MGASPHSRSIATLRDFAILGVAAHAHAAASHSPDAAAAPLAERARHWQRLAGRLAFFRGAAPPDELAHTDLAAVAGLLSTVVPLAGARLSAASDPEMRRTGALLNGAVRIMAEVAAENARTFSAFTRTGTVYVRARSLTGEEVTDDPVAYALHTLTQTPAVGSERGRRTLFAALAVRPAPSRARHRLCSNRRHAGSPSATSA